MPANRLFHNGIGRQGSQLIPDKLDHRGVVLGVLGVGESSGS